MTGICDLKKFIYILIFIDIHVQCRSYDIQLPQGNVRGLRSFSDDYRVYLGIPYASVNERFQDPGPPPQWNRTFRAVRGSVKCKQIDNDSQNTVGQEDCLVLNVFTPITPGRRPLPVLVFIHGGGFYYGSNSDLKYHPKYLLRKGIIVVTVNYRVGAFGFLCLQTPEAPGNAGLKDQAAALRWVKKNIQYFGGDPNSITLFGQSVGASTVTYLLLSKETEGLFQRVIIASGSLLVPYSLDNDPIGTASRIANRMGYKTNDTNELLKIFQNASADSILKASHFDDKNDPLAPYVFRPCIDKSKHSFITDEPREIVKHTLEERNMTIIIGYTDMEGIKWAEKYDYKGLEDLNTNFSKIIPYSLIFANDEEKSKFVAEVKEFYFENATIRRNSHDALINYFSDSIIMYPLTAMTKYFLHTNVTVYNYYFQYDSNRNLNKQKTTLSSKPGASHGDDLFYTFDPLNFRAVPVTPNDAAVIDAMTSFWANVTKAGNPSTNEIQWIPSERDELKFLKIDRKIEMIPLPNKERLLFWESIFEKYKSY